MKSAIGKWMWVAAVTAAVVAGPAFAQKGTLEVKSEVFKEVQAKAADGTEQARTVPAPHALPGDEVLYITTIRNTGTAPADKLVVNNPVPAQLLYAGAAGDSADALVSVDGKTYDRLEHLLVTAADGSTGPASNSDVRFVRWTLNGTLKPGQAVTVSYHAVVK